MDREPDNDITSGNLDTSSNIASSNIASSNIDTGNKITSGCNDTGTNIELDSNDYKKYAKHNENSYFHEGLISLEDKRDRYNYDLNNSKNNLNNNIYIII